MTLKEKVAEIMPEAISDGDVADCPCDYEFLRGHYDPKLGCKGTENCVQCWDSEYIEDYVSDTNVGNKNIKVGTKWREKKTEEVITITSLDKNQVWFKSINSTGTTACIGSIARENFTKNYEYIEDNVNHPTHYQGKHECIDIMRVLFGDEAVKGFCKCNAFKYRFRAGRKEENTAEQDRKKAEWYEEYLFRMEEK